MSSRPPARPPTEAEVAEQAERDAGWTNPEWSPVWDGPVVVRGLSSHLAYLPGALGATAVVGAGAAVVGGLVAGAAGVGAGIAGAVVVAAFFGVSALLVAAADRRDPQLTLPVALGTYVGKVVFAGVLAFRVVDGPARWHGVFAASLGAALLAWLGAHAVWFWRTPPPTVERAAPDDPGTPEATEMNAG